jgi:ATP-binding cassette subfamily B protein
MLAVMMYMDWRLTLIALAVLPLLFLTSIRFSTQLRDASRRQRKKEGQLAASIYEGVDGVVLSKLFGQEKHHQRVLGKLISSDVKAGLRAKRIEASYERWVDVITALGTTLVLFFGVQQVLAGSPLSRKPAGLYLVPEKRIPAPTPDFSTIFSDVQGYSVR